MTNTAGTRTRSARHQIPIALKRALTRHKGQGMSLDKIYVKLWSESISGKKHLHNEFGTLYTSLSRVTDPKNLLVERFDSEVLSSIANSDKMKAMQTEFLKRGQIYGFLVK